MEKGAASSFPSGAARDTGLSLDAGFSASLALAFGFTGAVSAAASPSCELPLETTTFAWTRFTVPAEAEAPPADDAEGFFFTTITLRRSPCSEFALALPSAFS